MTGPGRPSGRRAPAARWCCSPQPPSPANAYADFTAFAETLYDDYLLVLSNVRPATDGAVLGARFSNDGGSTFRDTASDYTSDQSEIGNTNTSYILLATSTGVGAAAGEMGVSGTVSLHGMHGAAMFSTVVGSFLYRTTNAALFTFVGAGENRTAEANDALRLFYSTGNIQSGTARLYGLRKPDGPDQPE